MHMADALLSPAVGLAMWGASAACLAISARRVRASADDRMTPLMGVLGAFVFAAQMVNFAIPGTGSSGHLGGGLLLAVLLAPHAALIVIASVLSVQALFFADGGLLALGANAALLKGGHLRGKTVIDRLDTGKALFEFEHPRLKVSGHGTGCTLSSAIAANLALKKALPDACEAAGDYVFDALKAAYAPGKAKLSVLKHIAS